MQRHTVFRIGRSYERFIDDCAVEFALALTRHTTHAIRLVYSVPARTALLNRCGWHQAQFMRTIGHDIRSLSADDHTGLP